MTVNYESLTKLNNSNFENLMLEKEKNTGVNIKNYKKSFIVKQNTKTLDELPNSFARP